MSVIDALFHLIPGWWSRRMLIFINVRQLFIGFVSITSASDRCSHTPNGKSNQQNIGSIATH